MSFLNEKVQLVLFYFLFYSVPKKLIFRNLHDNGTYLMSLEIERSGLKN